VADWRVAETAEEAEKAADEIGFPVVVKVDSEAVVHKSDMHGVMLNLRDGHAVRAAVEKIRQKLEAPDLKFLVQKYLPGGKEVIAGAKAEDGLAHLVMFGLGGIHVEILKDAVFKLSPVTEEEAEAMVGSLKASAILNGVRGEKGVDRGGITGIISRLSQLVTEIPEIREIDLNPVMAFEDRTVAVDGRMSV
jgi:acetate---CoA ligase (ADP-forming)